MYLYDFKNKTRGCSVDSCPGLLSVVCCSEAVPGASRDQAALEDLVRISHNQHTV